ncbi:hypothetical protein WJX79_006787 [Trebouxia sp. C0005]
MVQAWWAAGLAVPVVLIRGLVTNNNKAKQEESQNDRFDGIGTDPSFVCERVCTSARLSRRMGGLAKDPVPNTCVTVCGTSATDACTEACQKTVCTNMQQVPAWNDSCLQRCTAECLRGRSF